MQFDWFRYRLLIFWYSDNTNLICEEMLTSQLHSLSFIRSILCSKLLFHEIILTVLKHCTVYHEFVCFCTASSTVS